MQELLQSLPIGMVTLSVLGLLAVGLLLSLLFQLGIWFIKFMLVSDDVNSPKYGFTNIVWERLLKVLPTSKGKGLLVRKLEGWGFLESLSLTPSYWDRSQSRVWFCDGIVRKHSLFKTKEEALDSVSHLKDTVSLWLLARGLLYLIVIDVLLVTLQTYFIETIILVLSTLFIWGFRKIVRMVYKNTKRINVHEEKITKLEEEV